MKITKRQLRRTIKEMANQEQDFVVGGYSGGYSSDSERYDYIVSAINKNDAKKKLKDAKPHLKKINAAPVTDYTELDPYSTFERLGESVNFSRGAQVKITKRQLRQIIKEEKTKLLNEWGDSVETGSDLIEFAKAYSGLGGAVQDQVDSVVAAYNNSAPGSEEFMEVVHEQNPNAIGMAYDKLGRILGMMEDDDAIGIQEALQAAMEAFEDGP